MDLPKGEKRFLSRLLSLVAIYWKGSDKKKGLVYLAASVIFSLALVYIQYLLTQWNQGFYDSLEKYDSKAFFKAIQKFFILATVFVTIAVYKFIFTQRLIVRWRKWLTEHALDQYLNHSEYYRWRFLKEKTDNPDQRISEDVREFVDTSVSLGLDLFSQIITLATFSTLLWNLSGGIDILGLHIPGYMFWVSLLYALAGTYITRWIGRRLAPLGFKQQRLEADFRYQLIRVREHAESIEFLNGSQNESGRLKRSLNFIIGNMMDYIRERKRLAIFTTAYGTIANIFPIVVAAPRYFAKVLSLGQVFQIASAFGRVNDAMSFFVDAYSRLASFISVVDRLFGFYTSTIEARQFGVDGMQVPTRTSDSIHTENVEIQFAEQSRALKIPAFNVKGNDSVLIQGGSGIGKSTFFRVLSGLWPFYKGKVNVPADMMVIPQHPYLSIGSLKEQITYPNAADQFSDTQVIEALRLSSLDSLIDRLGEEKAWHQILSLGEQQRVAWARVFLKKPKFLLVDEGTSALDQQLQSALYQNLKKHLPELAVVSIAHRTGLKEFHDQVVEFK